MLEDIKQMLKEIEADDELFELMAKIQKKSFDALVKQGFGTNQAMEIMKGGGMNMKAS